MKEKIITLHQSNSQEFLIEILAILIKKNENNIFSTDVIITSSNSIKNYIDKKLSEILGVTFNIKYQTINSFIWNAIHVYSPNAPTNNPYNVETIKWFLINLFYSKEYENLLPEKIVNLFNSLLNSNEITIYDFATNLAILYDQYIIFRPQMIAAWANNKQFYQNEDEKWQMLIWNYLADKISQPNRSEIFYMLDKILSNCKHNKLKYQRIFVLGQTSLAPSYIYALETLAQIIDVHLLFFNPSEIYWTNFNKKNTITDKNINPLLISLSKQYRDFFDEINNLNLYYSKFIPNTNNNNNNNTLLHIIQNDIKNFSYPSKINIEKLKCNSLNIISAYNEIRELQILKDHILNYLANNQNKQPFDIMVSSPNIEKYIPFIHGIFGQGAFDNAPIKYNILDTKALYKQEFLQTIEQILNLVNSRFEVSSAISIIENKLILKKFNLSDENIPLIKEIINQLDIHWGWDLSDRKKFGDTQNLFTWEQAIQRIILGIFLIEEDDDQYKLWFNNAPFYLDIYPYDTIIINLINLFNTLGNIYNNFKNQYTIYDWVNNIKTSINELIFHTPQNQNIKIQFEQELNNLIQNCHLSNFNHQIPFNLIHHIILQFLHKPKNVSINSGGVTFCNLVSSRSIPYSFIALLGLNDTAFPREKFKLPFDLIETYPQKGDSSRKEDDKYLFLETILTAKDTLYLSYIGKDIQNGKNLAPSTLINEIIETVATMVQLPFEQVYNQLIQEYPLQSFSKKYYVDNNLFTYTNKYFDQYTYDIKQQKEIKFISTNYTYQNFNHSNDNIINALKLIDFWKNPIKYWLLKTYQWKNFTLKSINDDNEPVDFDIYNNYDQIYLKAKRNDINYTKINNFLKKQSKLPTGVGDEYFLTQLNEQLQLIDDNIVKSPKIKNHEFKLEFTDFNLKLNIHLNNIYQIGQIEFINSKYDINEYQKIKFYLKHLFYCCYECKNTYIISAKKTITLKAIDAVEAKQQLAKWIKYYLIGIKNPLPFLVKTSYTAAEKIQSHLSKDGNKITYPPEPNSSLYQKVLEKFIGKNYYNDNGEINYPEYKLIWHNNYPFDDKLFWILAEKLLLPLLKNYGK